MPRCAWIVVFASLALGASPGSAQDNPPEGSPTESGRAETAKGRNPVEIRCTPLVALRVQLVITRLLGEKKEASLPYTFMVSPRPSTSCRAERVRMRMGVDTPVPSTAAAGADSPKPPPMPIQYQNVGTKIDCGADDFGDGRFRLYMTVENSSLLSGSQAKPPAETSGYPLFRRFEISVDPILRDGQSIQTVASTDPVTGEVVKIDVALQVVK
jgi:hypothetical protein